MPEKERSLVTCVTQFIHDSGLALTDNRNQIWTSDTTHDEWSGKKYSSVCWLMSIVLAPALGVICDSPYHMPDEWQPCGPQCDANQWLKSVRHRSEGTQTGHTYSKICLRTLAWTEMWVNPPEKGKTNPSNSAFNLLNINFRRKIRIHFEIDSICE